MLAALNTIRGRRRVACRQIIRETMMRGGKYVRPLIAHEGLGHALVEPALASLRAATATVRFGDRGACARRRDRRSSARLRRLEGRTASGTASSIAVPPRGAALVPGLTTPTSSRAIVNAHFRLDPPADLPPMMGIIQCHHRVALLLSGGYRRRPAARIACSKQSREELAATIWRKLPRLPGFRARCRLGRSCASAARPLRQRLRRMPGVRVQNALGNLYLAGRLDRHWVCRRRSKVPFGQAIAPPIWLLH